jgi:alpha-tubulin suppressor-like RCC1 family protein
MKLVAPKKWMVSGRNDFGQLGLGHWQSPVTTWTEFIPKQQFQQISSSIYSTKGQGFSVAVGVDGSVWSWGSNHYGQLGLGISVSLRDVISSPQKISFFNEKQDPVITINAGHQHAGVVTSMPFISIWEFVFFCKTTINNTESGKLFTWGWNFCGQLGNGNTSDSSSPCLVDLKTPQTNIQCGMYHTVSLSSI